MSRGHFCSQVPLGYRWCGISNRKKKRDKKYPVKYIAVILNSGNILESRLVNKSFSLDEEFLHIPEEDFVVLIFFWIV